MGDFLVLLYNSITTTPLLQYNMSLGHMLAGVTHVTHVTGGFLNDN